MSDRSAKRGRMIRVLGAFIVGTAAACSDASHATSVGPVSSPASSPPVESSPPNTQIVFVGPKAGNDQQIFLMSSDGSGITPLTSGPGVHTDPAWSPDGTRLAFTNATTGGLYVMNADGSGVKRLTSVGENPAWSPDGSQIAFAATQPDTTGTTALVTERIAIVNADGSDFTWISSASPPGHQDMMPAWSPDRRRIAYVRGGLDDVPSLIYITSLDGLGGTNAITYLPAGSFCAESAPAWSPDGRSLLFWSFCAAGIGGSDHSGFAIGNSDGSGAMTPITSGVDETYYSEPEWSTDGKWIVFSTNGVENAASDIYVMRADGSHATRLTAGIKPGWRPRIAP